MIENGNEWLKWIIISGYNRKWQKKDKEPNASKLKKKTGNGRQLQENNVSNVHYTNGRKKHELA